MDETMVSSNKKFKVLVSQGRVPLSESPPVYPHITACITVSASGYVMKPLFILKNKKTLNGLEEVANLGYFATSPSGWINKNLFTYWGYIFLAEIQRYRAALPIELRNERILLLVDGHKSRANYHIAKLFDDYGIDLLVFPGHTSHLLQPFDVGIASSLKTAYKKKLLLYDLALNNAPGQRKKNMREVRIMMIKCLISALSEAASYDNVQSGFRASGLYPLNPQVPLSSHYAMDSSLRDKYPDLYRRIQNGNLVNNHYLNGSQENLQFTYKVEHKADITSDKLRKIAHDDMRNMIAFLHMYSQEWGKVLTPIPDLIEENNGFLMRINIDKNYPH